MVIPVNIAMDKELISAAGTNIPAKAMRRPEKDRIHSARDRWCLVICGKKISSVEHNKKHKMKIKAQGTHKGEGKNKQEPTNPQIAQRKNHVG